MIVSAVEDAEHPRVCGENHRRNNPTILVSGTSPRMRGKREEPKSVSMENRNIPAYAGKTSERDIQDSGKAEHPRVCGENTY